MIISKKKALILALIIITAVIFAGVIIYKGLETAGEEEVTAQLSIEKEDVNQHSPSEPVQDNEQKKILEHIYDRTYIFYDEFMQGKPVTYTFYDNGTMVAYYWEDTDSESIPLSSEWAKYTLNENATEITFNWDDGTKLTEIFKVKSNGKSLIIGEAEFKLSDRQIYIN